MTVIIAFMCVRHSEIQLVNIIQQTGIFIYSPVVIDGHVESLFNSLIVLFEKNLSPLYRLK